MESEVWPGGIEKVVSWHVARSKRSNGRFLDLISSRHAIDDHSLRIQDVAPDHAGLPGRPETGCPKQRHIASLGRLNKLAEKDLADIERGFRAFKSQIEIAPVRHRLPNRIRAHTFICFLALAIQRVIKRRLKKIGFPMSPEEFLYRLRAAQRHRVRLSTGKQLEGVATIRPEQRELFDAIGAEKPTGRRVTNAA